MIAKAIGFLLGLSLLGSVIYCIATATILQNWLIVAAIFVAILLIEFVVSRVFKKSEFVAELREGLKKFGKIVNSIIVSIALAVVYVLGIGSVWIVSRIVGKRFIEIRPKRMSTWNAWKKKDLESFEEMF